jgi:hypothetical protein
MTFFLLFAFGALLATSYIMMHTTPGCIQIPGWSSSSSSSSSSNPETVLSKNIRAPAAAPAATAQDHAATAKVHAATAALAYAAVPTLPSNLPPACTAPQMATLKIQLPEEGCSRFPWSQACSFTQATKGCQDPFWIRELYASQKLQDPFVAVFVGCDTAFDAMDILHAASRKSKYDVKSWKDSVSKADPDSKKDTCVRKTLTFPSPDPQTAKVYCLEPKQSNYDAMVKAKQDLDMGADELILDKMFIPDKAGALSHYLTTTKRIPADATIHYLSVSAGGDDWDVLMGSQDTLKRIQYIDFEYSWNGNWSGHPLKALIDMLKQSGFACYWSGNNGDNLWRITDCWLDFYNIHHWAHLTCVNTNLPEIAPVAKQMEALFDATLKMQFTFT